MPVTATKDATKESTYVITVGFYDEDGTAFTPKTDPTWTLTDEKGNIINSRENVVVTAAQSITIVLQANDLDIKEATNEKRIFIVKTTYDSSSGSNLPFVDYLIFDVVGPGVDP